MDHCSDLVSVEIDVQVGSFLMVYCRNRLMGIVCAREQAMFFGSLEHFFSFCFHLILKRKCIGRTATCSKLYILVSSQNDRQHKNS